MGILRTCWRRRSHRAVILSKALVLEASLLVERVRWLEQRSRSKSLLSDTSLEMDNAISFWDLFLLPKALGCQCVLRAPVASYTPSTLF